MSPSSQLQSPQQQLQCTQQVQQVQQAQQFAQPNAGYTAGYYNAPAYQPAVQYTQPATSAQIAQTAQTAQSFSFEPSVTGLKRPSEDVLQPVEVTKRPRSDSGVALAYYSQRLGEDNGVSLAYYPQRPGDKVCSFYMTTRTCSFGVTCKFDHPVWVPFGGIPNWKEVSTPSVSTMDAAFLPQRPGEPDCAFYMKTGECKYSTRCRFNHPTNRYATLQDKVFTKEDVAEGGQDAGTIPTQAVPTVERGGIILAMLNSRGLPLRPNDSECSFYIKTGSCKYGATCRFNHPEVSNAGGVPLVPTQGGQNPNPFPTVSTALPLTSSYTYPSVGAHPQRPGEPDCTYYLKTGDCSFGPTCRFHHPLDRQPSLPKVPVKLTLAGLPRREGEAVCAYYMKTGTCKFGSTCKFDHPPPGEVAVKVAVEASQLKSAVAPGVLDGYAVHQASSRFPVLDLNLPPSPLSLGRKAVGSGIHV